MALTREFRETVRERAQSDAAFRTALLSEATEALVAGDAEAARTLIHDYINATVGFETLADDTGITAKSLHRMFGPKGNPTLNNLTCVLRALELREKVKLHVSVQPAETE